MGRADLRRGGTAAPPERKCTQRRRALKGAPGPALHFWSASAHPAIAVGLPSTLLRRPLAARAEVAAPPRDNPPANLLPTAEATFAFPLIDTMAPLVAARLAFRVHVVRYRRATQANRYRTTWTRKASRAATSGAIVSIRGKAKVASAVGRRFAGGLSRGGAATSARAAS